MTLKIFIGSLVWIVLITLAHLQLNVGWTRMGKNIQVFLGDERDELVVGFLPVT